MSIDAKTNETTRQPLAQFCCADCGYPARDAPEECPLCGGSVWEYELWRPFSTRTRVGWTKPDGRLLSS